MQRFDPAQTPWHITFGTYGARLHGGDRPTVDRQRNEPGESFLDRDPAREQGEKAAMRLPAVTLSTDQQRFAQDQIPGICQRGGWGLRACAAGRDHVHVLCDVPKAVHGQKVRQLIKRWLGQALSQRWRLAPGSTWWADGGSSVAIKEFGHLNNAYGYILRQKA